MNGEPGMVADPTVFDCMVFLQAAARPQRVHEVWQAVLNGRLTLCISAGILEEVQDVLSRPKLRRKFPALTTSAAAAFLNQVLRHARLIHPVPRAFVLQRDQDDSPYLNVAIAAGASYLATRDKDLLSLTDPATPQADELARLAPDLQILTPEELAAQLAD